MKILNSADWHILLHKKKVPYKWQVNRFKTMFRKLLALEQQCDVHIISGDVFDKKPEADEVCLFLSYINSVSIPTYIIPGNHEATKKGETFLEHFTQENAIKNSNVHLITKNTYIQSGIVQVIISSFYFFKKNQSSILANQLIFRTIFCRKKITFLLLKLIN